MTKLVKLPRPMSFDDMMRRVVRVPALRNGKLRKKAAKSNGRKP
jgi:hypothetical protein